jgi:hypothetical protein
MTRNYPIYECRNIFSSIEISKYLDGTVSMVTSV